MAGNIKKKPKKGISAIKNRRKNKPRQSDTLLLIFIVLLLTVMVLYLSGKIIYHHSNIMMTAAENKDGPVTESPGQNKDHGVQSSPASVNTIPSYSEEAREHEEKQPDSGQQRHFQKHSGPGAPKVVIIIDDCGFSMELLRQLAALDIRTTPAILPHLRYSKDSYDFLIDNNIMPILHQPMEALSRDNVRPDPGEGAIYTGMGREDIFSVLEDNIGSMGPFTGANNHMGSHATAHYETMKAVLQYFNKKGMFFLDSRTTHDSVAGHIAKDLGLPFFERDLFLDNEKDIDMIRANIETLVGLAYQNGYAIGIGHLHPATIKALELTSKDREKYGVEFICINELAGAVYGHEGII